MTDPEVEYHRLVSGNVGAVRGAAEVLASARGSVDDARDEVRAAARVPVWSGAAATGFATRLEGLAQGAASTSAVVSQVYGALETAATAYDSTIESADGLVAVWRNRPGGLPPAIEQVLAVMVNTALVQLGASYGAQLGAVTAVLTGGDVDLDQLDGETRAWVEEGLARNEDWLGGDGSGSNLGPLIPNTLATGDDRGWIPQGMDHDPRSGNLLQAYYTKAGGSSMAVIDPVTGREVTEVQLGSTYYDVDGFPRTATPPSHAGGVTTVGDQTIVTDNGTVYTYNTSDIVNARPGDTVQLAGPTQGRLNGGSYSATDGTDLYLGDFENDTLHVYRRDQETGAWEEYDQIDTPENAQGVVVRDGELVFSTSHTRYKESALVVQDRETGERSEPYPLPNMSQSVVEVDGHLLTTFESGAEEFDHVEGGSFWDRVTGKVDDLWANPYMVSTPLSELGLAGDDVEVEPSTLDRAAGDLDTPASMLATAASRVGGVSVPAGALGQVPAATTLLSTVSGTLEVVVDSLRLGSSAVRSAAEVLEGSATAYRASDDGVRQRFTGPTP